MSNESGPAKFIVFTTIASLAVFFWVFDGMPIPMVEVRPLQVDPNLPTWEESVAAGEVARQRERQRGTTAIPHSRQGDGNSEHNAIRQEVLDAYKSYKRATCNASKRQRLLDAITALDSAMDVTFRRCRNGGCGDGGARETWKTPFDDTVHYTIAKVTEEGLIDRGELMHLHGIGVLARSAADREMVDTYRRCQR
ncbi:MAG: hypothetical protein COA62_05560 [Rhodobiaceae bacterium]|nr:MAG: hypothetical protein COA62_05560 [Rhodobiaceae bacterium]